MKTKTTHIWHQCSGVLCLVAGLVIVPWGFSRYSEHVNPVSLNQSSAQLAMLVTVTGLIFLIVGITILQTRPKLSSSNPMPEMEPIEAEIHGAEDSKVRREQPTPSVAKLNPHQQQSLGAILDRLRALLVERVGHIWSIENLPDIAELYANGVAEGHVPFPYGLFRWRIEESGGEIKLFYDDCARVASGWGRAYEITPTETRLTAEDID